MVRSLAELPAVYGTYKESVAALIRGLETGESSLASVLLSVHRATQAHAFEVGVFTANYHEAHVLSELTVNLGSGELSLREAFGMPDDRPEARREELLAKGWLRESCIVKETDGALWDVERWSPPATLGYSAPAPAVLLTVPHVRRKRIGSL